MANVALIIAGGSGNRMHQDIPKQFLTVNERPVIVYTLEAFQRHPEIDAIAVVCLEGWEQILTAYARQFNITKLNYIIPGGQTGQDSIRNGVFELEKHFAPDDMIIIHDGNRAFLEAWVISDNIRVARKHGNAIAAVPCTEVVMETEDGISSDTTHQRERLRRTQTPHAFRVKDICDLHREALKAGITNTAASCELIVKVRKNNSVGSGQIFFSKGSEKNIKLTTVEDIDIFKALLSTERSSWLK